MLSRVKQNLKVVAICGDVMDTNFNNNSVDVVIMSDMLHHVQDQKRLIGEMHRILKKNGKLLILDFEKRHIKTMILRIFEYVLFGKLYFRTSKEVINLIQNAFLMTQFIDNKYYFIIKGEKNA